MKNSRTCSKCKSEKVLRFNGSVGPYGVGNNIQISGFTLSAVRVNRYVCTECGFVEEWVDAEDFEKLSNSGKAR